MPMFAAKINALINRAAARDLYDCFNMIEMGLFETDRDMFRKCIVFYASISASSINKLFDTSEIEKIDFNKIKRELFPVIEIKANFNLKEMKERVQQYITELMNLTAEEKEYLEKFKNNEYRPDLLFEDSEIIDRIKDHPMALWKCR